MNGRIFWPHNADHYVLYEANEEVACSRQDSLLVMIGIRLDSYARYVDVHENQNATEGTRESSRSKLESLHAPPIFFIQRRPLKHNFDANFNDYVADYGHKLGQSRDIQIEEESNGHDS